MDQAQVNVLTQRFERLERDCRRWKAVSALILVGALVIVSTGAKRPGNADVVEAESFVLKSSKDGSVIGSWKGDANGTPFFVLYDNKGKEQITMTTFLGNGTAYFMIGTRDGGHASFLTTEKTDSAIFSVGTKSKVLLAVPAK